MKIALDPQETKRENAIIVGSVGFLILSLLDGALTLWGLGLSAIEEANPVMKCLIEKSPIAFMTVKLFLPIILGSIFWRIRKRSFKFVTCSLGLLLIVYSIMMLFHLYWITSFLI